LYNKADMKIAAQHYTLYNYQFQFFFMGFFLFFYNFDIS
jgi:hypothetical protein